MDAWSWGTMGTNVNTLVHAHVRHEHLNMLKKEIWYITCIFSLVARSLSVCMEFLVFAALPR